MVWPTRAWQQEDSVSDTSQPYAEPDRRPAPDQQEVPKDAVDAQAQAFIDEATDEATAAQRKAKQARERAEDYEKKASQPEAKAPEKDERPRDAFGQPIAQPGDVVAVAGPRHVDMTTTEDDRLVRHKAMVRDHLRNADPDMTGGKGEDEIDGRTGLPKGHVPEGHADAPILGGRDPADPVVRP